MNFNLAARLAAVALGASFILNSISRSAVLFARHGPDAGPSIYVVAAIPIIAATILAWVIFAYAKSLRFEEGEISASGVLIAGVKLFGMYLIITAVPSLVGTWSASQVALDQSSDVDPSIFFARALISVIYIAIGLLFVLRTNWVFAVASRDLGRR